MARKIKKYLPQILISSLVFAFFGTSVFAQLGKPLLLRVNEPAGLSRDLEYIEFSLILPEIEQANLVAEDTQSGQMIPCQLLLTSDDSDSGDRAGNFIMPVVLKANESREFLLHFSDVVLNKDSDLNFRGKGLDIVVENAFYQADLTKTEQSEAKSHASGQLRELLIKMDYDVLLLRTENRMHWAPNFQRIGQENYQTIAGWETPAQYHLFAGPYLIRTERSDLAPDFPEIFLSATYSFYAGLPYFRFSSAMNMTEDIGLILLRNDEMTMDSLFTHVAFQRPDGTIEDLTFAEREQRLKEKPIEDNADWLCFYHADKGYAFGSIRIKYDNRNESGFASPTFNPHTKISNGAGGGKYWNRRLIDEKEVLVPKGSSYIEENAYLVFSVTGKDKFAEMISWYEQIRNPLRVTAISE